MLINPTSLEDRDGEAYLIGSEVWAQPMKHPFLRKTVFYSEKGKLFMDFGDLAPIDPFGWLPGKYCYEICTCYDPHEEGYMEERYFSEEEAINRVKDILGL